MISIYKSDLDLSDNLIKINSVEPGSWINLVAPTDQELILISKKTCVPLDFLKAALDDEETSRLDVEDGNTLIIVDIPFTEVEENSLTYDTYPLGIIHTDSYIITICIKNSRILNDFITDKIKSFYTFKRSRFILQILYRVSSYYLSSLRQINKKSLMLQGKLHKSMNNKVLMQLLSLQNSTVYFSTSLKSNEVTLEKISKLEFAQKYEEDKELLEDVIIETKQAIEMTQIYGGILQATMDTSANIINNNVNTVMKFLTSVTIAMAIPNIISGIFGMNITGLPFSVNESGGGFAIVISIILGSTLLTILFLNRRGLFK
ncbi:magnesium transporter CorA family protein [Clostridium cellulovorans]|uniref:Mg2 transporter protein CorA family protein n=1 Tax=Clostridium cellulovorans (strain ATCC 35296 / DSM 3052 / OCM 3 / 743B) TaxID=573061 RepID=D9SNL2_CLOC7|nr:magnesium transporter CorA family protein [Clostridium cellulovorans]ADL49883.1 Mg2 transporter protein CorA family protein [Clostridium cellulovorans 743B]